MPARSRTGFVMDRWNETHEVGGSDDTGNVEYFRALKRTNEGGPATTPAQVYPGDQRRYPRYKCEGSVEFRTEQSSVRTWATVTDLSRSGCYVEMQATSPVDARVDMMIEVTGLRVHAKGVIRVSYPFLGMGIAFTEIAEVDQEQLDEVLVRLASGITSGAYAQHASEPDMSRVRDARAVLNDVAAFFRQYHTLTRERFAELVVKHGGQ